MRGGATVWLVGMMGAGKSAVGRALAARLGCTFIDADAEVEREAGTSIATLFEREGEAGFRARERAVIERLAGAPGVVALGGGAMTQPGASELLARTGAIVFLRARPETLVARLGEARARPLLRGLDADQRLVRVRALCAERSPYYERAEIAIDTDELDVQAVAAEAARRIEERRR